jgi:DNA-directed RNA polymerase subunit RPC12/RpoP
MKHWYFVVRCAKCKAKLPIKYLGTGDRQPPPFPSITAEAFSTTCTKCGHRADYTFGDLRAGPLDPPVSGFVDLVS